MRRGNPPVGQYPCPQLLNPSREMPLLWRSNLNSIPLRRDSHRRALFRMLLLLWLDTLSSQVGNLLLVDNRSHVD